VSFFFFFASHPSFDLSGDVISPGGPRDGKKDLADKDHRDSSSPTTGLGGGGGSAGATRTTAGSASTATGANNGAANPAVSKAAAAVAASPAWGVVFGLGLYMANGNL